MTNKSETAEQNLGALILRAGQRAPQFRLLDQHGHVVTLSALLKDGPAVLRFCRRYDLSLWLGELATLHIEIQKRGATLAVIATRPPQTHPPDEDPEAPAFLLLTDRRGKVARSYGLAYGPLRSSGRSSATAGVRNERWAREGESAPATYIVDRNCLIALAFVDLEGCGRMAPDQIVVVLDCLAKRKGTLG